VNHLLKNISKDSGVPIKQISPKIIEVMGQMLQLNPTERITPS